MLNRGVKEQNLEKIALVVNVLGIQVET